MTAAAEAKPAQETPTAQIVAVAALGLILVVIVATRFWPRRPAALAASSSAIPSSTRVSTEGGEIDFMPLLAVLQRPLPQLRSSQLAATNEPFDRDPFLPAGSFHASLQRKRTASSSSNPTTQPKFVLKGILRDANGTVAYVNDSIVALGDKVGGFIVREISQWQVLLEKDGAVLTLRLPTQQLLERP